MIQAQMATMPGREMSKRIAIQSLVDQVTWLNVIHNGYIDGDGFACRLTGNVMEVYSRNANGSDGWKFYEADIVRDGYILIVDDDIEYPPDFAEKMVEKVEEYNRKAVITCMGKNFKTPIQSFYKDEFECFKTFDTLTEDKTVQIPGTCAMMYHSSLCPDLNHRYFKSMNSDIWMGRYCKERNIPCIVMAHRGDWLKNLMPLNCQVFSVFDNYKNNDAEMTALVNSFL